MKIVFLYYSTGEELSAKDFPSVPATDTEILINGQSYKVIEQSWILNKNIDYVQVFLAESN